MSSPISGWQFQLMIDGASGDLAFQFIPFFTPLQLSEFVMQLAERSIEGSASDLLHEWVAWGYERYREAMISVF